MSDTVRLSPRSVTRRPRLITQLGLMISGAHLFLRQAGYELERVLTGRNEYAAGAGKALTAFNEHLQKNVTEPVDSVARHSTST